MKVEQMLTGEEVAKLLHIHLNTVRRWSDKGVLANYRIGSRGDLRFKVSDIKKYLRECKRG